MALSFCQWEDYRFYSSIEAAQSQMYPLLSNVRKNAGRAVQAPTYSWFSYKQFRCFSERDGVLMTSLTISESVSLAQGTDDRIPSNLCDSFGCNMTFFPGSLFTSSQVKLNLFLVISTLFSLPPPATSHFRYFAIGSLLLVPGCPWALLLVPIHPPWSLQPGAGATLCFSQIIPPLVCPSFPTCSPHSKIPCVLLPRVSSIKIKIAKESRDASEAIIKIK